MVAVKRPYSATRGFIRSSYTLPLIAAGFLGVLFSAEKVSTVFSFVTTTQTAYAEATTGGDTATVASDGTSDGTTDDMSDGTTVTTNDGGSDGAGAADGSADGSGCGPGSGSGSGGCGK